MKIAHLCLSNFYIDNYGYQENILTKMHQKQGHDVLIIASTDTFVDGMTLGTVPARSYTTETGIPIVRIPYVNWLPYKIARKLRIYIGLKEHLENFNPDIIFSHDLQFLDILTLKKYIKKHPKTRLIIDNHNDFINSARTFLSKNVLHKFIYKRCAHIILPYTDVFYGVLPARVDFLVDFYKIPKEKVRLLIMGGDDTAIDFKNRVSIREEIRKRHNIKSGDFLLISGGKIDKRKRIDLLTQSVISLNNPAVKLLLFGTISSDLKKQLIKDMKHPCIRYISWLDSREIYNYFLAADLGFFPGTHSILWEQALSTGLPCVFKKWEGFNHLDLKGNALFLNKVSINTITKTLERILSDKKLYDKMKEVSSDKGVIKFSFYKIAQESINI